MKVRAKCLAQDENNNLKLADIDVKDMKVPYYSIIAIDGSTTNTGIVVLRESDGALMHIISASRDKDEEPVRYKIRLKKMVEEILRNNRMIQVVYYEEPCIEYKSAIKNLFMLRTFIEEIKIENEPEFDYLTFHEVNNKRWKKIFLEPDKLPNGTEAEKKAVREGAEKRMPCLSGLTQDEIDAYGLGLASVIFTRTGRESKELESQKKPRSFKYEIRFYGCDDEDDFFDNFFDTYDGPQSIVTNGITLYKLNGREDFNNAIYKEMGNDDKVVVLKYSTKYYGNLAIQFQIGRLATTYDYIYAVVWRKARKK